MPTAGTPWGYAAVLAVTTTSTDPAAKYGLPSLEELLHRPEWMADALCREYPDVSFFLERGEDPGPAKAVCSRCLVREECAAAAASEWYGIWGGESARERKRLIRSRGHRGAA